MSAKRDFSSEYPSLFRSQVSERQADRIIAALEIIHGADEHGSIRNADYIDAKDTLNRAVDSGWDEIQKLYLSVIRGRDDRFDPVAVAASELYYGPVSGLHDVLSLRKKIAKAEKAGLSGTGFQTFLEGADRFEKELVGLAGIVRALKQKVVKGRAPRPEPVPANPDQVRGTCPVCFSDQAIRNGTLVHHGYQRPGEGYQTASCTGIRFRPFERSVAGTEAMIESLTKHIAKCQNVLADRENWPSVTMLKSVRRSAEFPNGYKLVEILRGADGWKAAYEEKVREWQAKQRQAETDLAFYEQKKTEWKLEPLRKADGTILPLDFEG